MIESEALANGLFTCGTVDQRDCAHGIGGIHVPIEETTLTGYYIVSIERRGKDTGHTFVAMYDWKRDSYQPNEMLSTIFATSAPSKERSTSGDQTPSLSGRKRLSLVIAMWMGIRHISSTSHSPARNVDRSRGYLRRNAVWERART